LPDNYVFSLAEDTEGRIWVTTHGPVGYLQNGKFVPVNNPSIRPGFFTADTAGNLWLTHNRSGLSRLRGAEVVEHFPWPKLGIQGSFNPLAVDTVNGGVWVGSLAGELVYLKDGQVQASYGHNTGLGTGRLNSLHLDSKGALWAATDGGLSHIQNSHVITLTSKNGLPCDTVLYSEEDDEHALWVLTTCGLARLARTELDAWIADPQRRIQAAVFDASDGVPVRIGFSGATPLTAKAADGKLWFLGRDGALVVDPRHLSSNKFSPPVRIEQVKADGKLYQLRQKMQLPAKVRDLWIDYTALSLVAPERVHFKYVALKRHLGDIPHVMGDRVQLQQVILNLALNGLEAMDHSSLDGPKELTVRSSRDNAETVVVEIQDSGAGLEDPERIFEPFFTTKTTGTGLGLPICRSIVKAHGGKLWAESNEGPGTIFRFTLPVQHSGAS